jgi:hypothetical protein
MGKTYRRKNYEDTRGNSWDRQGRKVNGYYTTYDQVVIGTYKMTRTEVVKKQIRHYHPDGPYWVYKEYQQTYTYEVPIYQKFYRPMTTAERIATYKWDHCDQKSNRRSPGRMYRKSTVEKNRRQQNREVQKFMANPDYEPMFENRTRDKWMDW